MSDLDFQDEINESGHRIDQEPTVQEQCAQYLSEAVHNSWISDLDDSQDALDAVQEFPEQEEPFQVDDAEAFEQEALAQELAGENDSIDE